MTTTINVSWAQPDERTIGRTDPCWYVYQSTSDLVCTVSDGERSIGVYADGEMRIRVINESDETIAVIRYCDEIEEWKITNDRELAMIVYEPDVTHIVEGISVRFEVDNSPWFDLYDDKGEHLDWVDYDLTDSINKAASLLRDKDTTTH